MLFGEIEQRGLQRAKTGAQRAILSFHIQPQIKRDLIVPAARGVKLPAGRADPFRERRFDVHVHIFQRSIPLEFAGFDLLLDCAQCILDLLPLSGGDDACRGERGGVRD